MGGAAGGEDVIDQKNRSALESVRQPGSEGIFEVVTPFRRGESDLFFRGADLAKGAVREGLVDDEAPFMGEDFGGVVGARDALRPVLRNGNDEVNRVGFELREETRSGDVSQGTEESAA